jgi:hypothetical protein
LQAAGFVPLVSIGCAEHWVRDSKRVILYVDADDANNAVCDSTMLRNTAFVEFMSVRGVLVASVL